MEKRILEFANETLRTLILAYKYVDSDHSDYSEDELENNLILITLVGIKDPLRPAVIKAVEDCHTA